MVKQVSFYSRINNAATPPSGSSSGIASNSAHFARRGNKSTRKNSSNNNGASSSKVGVASPAALSVARGKRDNRHGPTKKEARALRQKKRESLTVRYGELRSSEDFRKLLDASKQGAEKEALRCLHQLVDDRFVAPTARQRFLTMARILASPDETDRSAIYYAATGGNVQLVRTYLAFCVLARSVVKANKAFDATDEVFMTMKDWFGRLGHVQLFGRVPFAACVQDANNDKVTKLFQSNKYTFRMLSQILAVSRFGESVAGVVGFHQNFIDNDVDDVADDDDRVDVDNVLNTISKAPTKSKKMSKKWQKHALLKAHQDDYDFDYDYGYDDTDTDYNTSTVVPYASRHKVADGHQKDSLETNFPSAHLTGHVSPNDDIRDSTAPALDTPTAGIGPDLDAEEYQRLVEEAASLPLPTFSSSEGETASADDGSPTIEQNDDVQVDNQVNKDSNVNQHASTEQWEVDLDDFVQVGWSLHDEDDDSNSDGSEEDDWVFMGDDDDDDDSDIELEAATDRYPSCSGIHDAGAVTADGDDNDDNNALSDVDSVQTASTEAESSLAASPPEPSHMATYRDILVKTKGNTQDGTTALRCGPGFPTNRPTTPRLLLKRIGTTRRSNRRTLSQELNGVLPTQQRLRDVVDDDDNDDSEDHQHDYDCFDADFEYYGAKNSRGGKASLYFKGNQKVEKWWKAKKSGKKTLPRNRVQADAIVSM